MILIIIQVGMVQVGVYTIIGVILIGVVIIIVLTIGIVLIIGGIVVLTIIEPIQIEGRMELMEITMDIHHEEQQHKTAEHPMELALVG